MANSIQIQNRTYSVVDDLTIVYRALITGAVKDEVTGAPPRTRFVVHPEQEDLQTKVLDGGLFCIAGYAERVFPDLNAMSYTIDLVITADGYREARLSVSVPQNASFPIHVPMTVQLRPYPIRIQGRVVENTTDRNPISKAKVLIVDSELPGPLSEHVVALRTPLHFDHADDVTVRERPLIPDGPSMQLAANALAGKRTLALNNRDGLAANAILRIGSEIQFEYAILESLASEPADLSQPGEVTLRNALNRSFPTTTEVRRITLGAIGATRQLAREADAGDGVLILNDVLAADTIEVADPAPEFVEYHMLGALTNSEGFYRLDSIARVLTVSLKITVVGYEPMEEPFSWTINYGQPTNIVDFRLTPSP